MSTVGAIGASAINGKASTEKIKGLETGFWGGRIRPDLEYNFQTKASEIKGLILFDF
jgi:hypothetical protein